MNFENSATELYRALCPLHIKEAGYNTKVISLLPTCKMVKGSPYGSGISGLLKRGWHEIPGVMGGTVMALIGLGMIGYSAKKYYDEDRVAPRYKNEYIVYRSDDPRAYRKTREGI